MTRGNRSVDSIRQSSVGGKQGGKEKKDGLPIQTATANPEKQ